MEKHEKYMRRCVELAQMGEGNVAPNPMVGAVIVYNDQIIGEGYHKKFGEAHAEVHAIQSVKDKTLLPLATLYVSLEPCTHHGKTPPCSDLILANKIPSVVIGSKDTFSEVNGKGIERLRTNGVNVVTGVLERECKHLNKRFFTFHEKKRPYIILKWAQTKDGFIDKLRQKDEKGVNWISEPTTRSLVHLWRSHEMGILIGRKTAETDNPQLNVRDVVGKNPIRIILDSDLKTESDLFQDKEIASTIILNTNKSLRIEHHEFLKIQDLEIPTILEALWQKNIQSILVEGGTNTLQRFLIANAWDEIRIIEGNVCFHEGLKAPTFNKLPKKIVEFGQDKVYYYWK